MLQSLLLLSLVAPLSGLQIGVDVSDAVSQKAWACLRTPGGQGSIEYAVVRAWRSSNSFDPNAVSTIKAARAAGIADVDVYLFPCVPCGDPAGQVTKALPFPHPHSKP